MRTTISAFAPLLECRDVVRYWTPLVALWLIVAAPAGARSAATLEGLPYEAQTTAPLAAAGGAAAELARIRSLLVSWRGALVVERYFNGARAASPANIKSASKSVISALVGIAIDSGSITGVRSRSRTFFPERSTAPKPTPPSAQITIENLLTMRSGLESTSNRNYGAWVQSAQLGASRARTAARWRSPAPTWTTAPATRTCCPRF